MALRAAGNGFRVYFVQFLKDGTSGESGILKTLPGVVWNVGFPVKKFTFQMNEEELEQTQRELDGAWTTVANLSDWQEHLIRAMDLFWQIDEAYVLGRYSLCRTLIQALEEGGLSSYLPQESITDNGRFSPADRYQEIRDALY